MNETWKDIKGYEGLYQVSKSGKIKTLPREVRNTEKSFRKLGEKIHIPCDNGNGYKYVTLSSNRKVNHVYIHRAVAEAFLCNCFELPEVNHIDGDKSNNHIDNLEWCTRGENMKHAHKSGLTFSHKGEDSYNAKLTEEKVLKVRELFATGKYMQITLADMFGISRGYIHAIVHRTKWKHI